MDVYGFLCWPLNTLWRIYGLSHTLWVILNKQTSLFCKSWSYCFKMNDHRWHESAHPTAKDLWLTSCSPASEYVVSHPDPSLLITSFFFFLHNQDGGDGGNAQTRDRYANKMQDLKLHQPSSKYSLWEACEVLMCTSALITVCSSNNTIFIWCFELLESNFHITATPLHSICFNKGSFVVYTGTYQVSVETWLSSFPEYGASADTGSITGKCHQIK